ncbi:Male sterility protein [Popillia japonica]|uniref:Fatty acyl-CoA reductase n=1 Tax=Popillia japonica TaxID=7064 RepID=A0AAW1LXU6_POPJA
MVSVSDFYNGKTVFITGGTGFMGKVLLEKLLRSCSGVAKIYLLIRPKKGQQARERLQQLLSSPNPTEAFSLYWLLRFHYEKVWD